jgi:hypothetical protein
MLELRQKKANVVWNAIRRLDSRCGGRYSVRIQPSIENSDDTDDTNSSRSRRNAVAW